jgi:pyruvate formate lyase activating enzyme
MALTGLISNVQRFSVHDGPGIRTTVFLKGCPLRCAWCHNPETIAAQPEILLVESRCIRCGACVVVCPNHQPVGEFPDAVPGRAETGRDPAAARAACLVCGACVEACPVAAREVVGREVSVAALLEEVRADEVFFATSGGGVTFSGGEPLAQFAFLRAALAACREAGLRTAVDTCGFAPREQVAEMAALTDLVLYDVKSLDPDRHRAFCGVSNERILENLRWLGTHHEAVWLRVPLIPGFNDAPAELRALAELAARLPGVRQVNLLPYHAIGAQKATRVGRPLPDHFAAPTPEQIAVAQEPFRQLGVPVRVGG